MLNSHAIGLSLLLLVAIPRKRVDRGEEEERAREEKDRLNKIAKVLEFIIFLG